MVLLYMTFFFFLVISKKRCLCQVVKTASVVFNFPVHWPSYSLSDDGMKAPTKNLLHWSSEISLCGEKTSKTKKSIGFFSFKIAKSKSYKIKTILMKTFTTVVNKFVVDAESKVCLRH